MREIKFRAKTVNGKWLYGNLQVPSVNGVPYYMWDEDKFQRPVDENTIGQYTGLKDKNGKEIYEGDIIRSYDSENNPVIHYIHWNNSNACYVATMPQYSCIYSIVAKDWIEEYDKEIIGNIHDNRDLIEVNTNNYGVDNKQETT